MFKVQQIDHVELFVPERYEAARWYERTLGLQVVPECEPWAVDGGPLMISSDDGSTKLALFTGQPGPGGSKDAFYRVAFRVTGGGFAEFLRRLPELGLTNSRRSLSLPTRWSIINRRTRSISTIPRDTCSK